MTSSESEQQSPVWSRQTGLCSVEGCDRDVAKTGLCSAHYQRKRTTGDVRAHEPLRPKQSVWGVGKCSIKKCDKPMRKRGWCMLHYDRWRRHGSPDFEARPQGHRRLDGQGYVLVHSGGTAPIEFEHRLMWEAKFGPLLPGQNVHHKNGDRADNRYENFELWDTVQPAGQRPEDKVEFSVQMLRRYAPHLLAENATI